MVSVAGLGPNQPRFRRWRGSLKWRAFLLAARACFCFSTRDKEEETSAANINLDFNAREDAQERGNKPPEADSIDLQPHDGQFRSTGILQPKIGEGGALIGTCQPTIKSPYGSIFPQKRGDGEDNNCDKNRLPQQRGAKGLNAPNQGKLQAKRGEDQSASNPRKVNNDQEDRHPPKTGDDEENEPAKISLGTILVGSQQYMILSSLRHQFSAISFADGGNSKHSWPKALHAYIRELENIYTVHEDAQFIHAKPRVNSKLKKKTSLRLCITILTPFHPAEIVDLDLAHGNHVKHEDQHNMSIKHAGSDAAHKELDGDNQRTKERDEDSNVDQEGDISDEHAESEEKANGQIAAEVNNKIHVVAENFEAAPNLHAHVAFFQFSHLRGRFSGQAREMKISDMDDPRVPTRKLRTKLIMLLVIQATLDPG